MELPTVTVEDLQNFHAKHFPLAPTPQTFLGGAHHDVETGYEEYEYEEDDLGYYEDGTKRTLTDEQIAIFRNTEIHNIIRERRRRRDATEPMEVEVQHSGSTSQQDSPDQSESGHRSNRSAHDTPSKEPDKSSGKGNIGWVEKQQDDRWVKRSDQSKKKQKRKNTNYRRNLKRKNQERRKSAEDNIKSDGSDKDVESDEWDPWRQATGPDAQKDTTVDLDY